VHVAVHLNAGNAFAGLIPIWHAIHAAQFKQVTYHVARNTNAKDPRPFAGVYPDTTYFMENLPRTSSGYRAYETAVQAWKVHDTTTAAMLWTNEDAFITDAFIEKWLGNTSACAMMAGHNPNFTSTLPSEVSAWNSTTWWVWATQLRSQLAATRFLAKAAGTKKPCMGQDFATDNFTRNQADVFGNRTKCKASTPGLYFEYLQTAAESDLFLEIAVFAAHSILRTSLAITYIRGGAKVSPHLV
jgi:hypothetical protein